MVVTQSVAPAAARDSLEMNVPQAGELGPYNYAHAGYLTQVGHHGHHIVTIRFQHWNLLI